MNKEIEVKMIPVSVLLSGRTYRIRVEPHLEEQLRKTAKLINDKVVEFKTTFPGKDMQDYTSMALLWYATQPMSQANDILGSHAVQENLEKMQELLNKALN